MKTRRRTYTAAFPESVTTRPRVQQVLPVSPTITRRKLRSDTAKERKNGGSKKKKCTRRELWDKNIPTDMLQEILSRLGLKGNIRASLVCKTWLEASVSLRKLQTRRPWLFYPQKESEEGDYILLDPSKSQTHHLKFPELKNHQFFCSKDGWLLVVTDSPSNLIFFLNPFTQERVYLPEVSPEFNGSCLTFSAPPTSTSNCFVIFFRYRYLDTFVTIHTWCPGESVWTKHRFVAPYYGFSTLECLFLNGLFYCLSTIGHLGVFDPFRATWNLLPVKQCPAYSRQILRGREKWITEHEGDIYLVTTQRKNNYKLLVFKLKLEDNVWEEMGESGLMVFASYASSFTIAGHSAKERNKICTPHTDDYGRLSGYGKDTQRFLSNRIAWLQPPHNVQL
ncbi:F-box/kelch-repeat protein [Cardamine amara subsp. amara]|uniref:F-box/kelch-repeat protein n=1 Tax=Cardamine amara subsp. amara TaxID=228776 RepID=A0ABD1BWL0_CARAN